MVAWNRSLWVIDLSFFCLLRRYAGIRGVVPTVCPFSSWFSSLVGEGIPILRVCAGEQSLARLLNDSRTFWEEGQ
jgi:hypothetical protein